MLSLLGNLLVWAMSSFLARVLLGAGLTLVTAAGLSILLTSALDQAVTALSGLPEAALKLALLGGAPEFFSIIGSALLTRAAYQSAQTVLGVKSA